MGPKLTLKNSLQYESQRQDMNGNALDGWLSRLETLHPNPIDLGLERVAAVANTLGLLPLSVPVITVAGTNGKGSTVAVLEALLGGTGLLTGAYTSPHFWRFSERIRVGGEEAGDEEVVAAFEAIEAARGATSLTYFEFATLAALLVFRARAVDVVVLEVGLGGRLDAVNVVNPSVAVITRIELDHQAWLGPDRDTIAREKAGIMRPAIPVVIGDPEPPATLLECAADIGANPVLCLGENFGYSGNDHRWRGFVQTREGARQVLPELVAGSLVPANICSAVQAALMLGVTVSDQQLSIALAQAQPRGRRERHLVAGREYVFDVSHNPSAVYKLVEYMNVTPCKGKTIAIFSAMDDKDIGAMIQAAQDLFSAWFVADQPLNARAAPAADVAALLAEHGQQAISVSQNLRQAFRRAQAVMAEGDRLVVFGSFFTVAEVLPLLERDRCKAGAGA